MNKRKKKPRKKIKEIFLASDHAGFELKEKIKDYLGEKYNPDEIIINDFGALEYDKKDDYPDFIEPMLEEMNKKRQSIGIVFGGSGQGEAICANKIKGIRAALYYGGSTKIVDLSRKHNDANVLSLGARFVKDKEAKKAVDIFLKTGFDEGRHLRRIRKIKRIERVERRKE
ncbi:RpiB/LacA/LacB family sugar-phosphate isomerase [Candidatus Pacearchaeota archaeon]|nr:RpiB/LacA/LacB family sugar-phosphate isomerase [Candidatus Pacearchaeota archaeon]